MNERIRELYRQANEQARQQACEKNKTLRPQNNTVWNEFVPLFAELLIRECANSASWAQDTDAKDIGGEVLKHFGVEE